MLFFTLYLTFFDSKRVPKLCISLLCSFLISFKLNLLFNSDNCPECYGNELCGFFRNNQIQLIWFSYFLSLFNPKWTKSVFHGFFNESRVVIKRKVGRVLGSDNLDVDINSNEIQTVVLCPSVRNKFFLLSQIKEGIERKKLWLDIKTSIEPLLLMYFQSLGTWPVPEYLGACGDFIVEEYKGKPLNSFLLSDFVVRTQLAIHLLKMADIFTFSHSDLAFYFIDYSLDNLVVDSNKGVYLVDLDSVIISNKSCFLENNSKKNIHSSEILDELKYAFSPSDICSHYISDHNYFSICKYLLAQPEEGLLNNIPEKVQRKEEILYLLSECVLPSAMSDRFSAGRQLQSLLEEIILEKMKINDIH